MTEISISDLNTVYAGRNGMLFDKVMENLIRCPEGKTGTCTLPEGIKGIGNNAFSRCRKLNEIILQEGLTRIGSKAFSSCSGIPEIELPSSLTNVGSYAFNGCKALKSIRSQGGLPDSL